MLYESAPITGNTTAKKATTANPSQKLNNFTPMIAVL